MDDDDDGLTFEAFKEPAAETPRTKTPSADAAAATPAASEAPPATPAHTPAAVPATPTPAPKTEAGDPEGSLPPRFRKYKKPATADPVGVCPCPALWRGRGCQAWGSGGGQRRALFAALAVQ